MPQRILCDVCSQPIPPHAHYVVRIDVFADPSIPVMSEEELAEMNFDEKLAELVEQMKHMSADDLQDQVHRRFEYRLCVSCQRKYIVNPLGLPREIRSNKN